MSDFAAKIRKDGSIWFEYVPSSTFLTKLDPNLGLCRYTSEVFSVKNKWLFYMSDEYYGIEKLVIRDAIGRALDGKEKVTKLTADVIREKLAPAIRNNLIEFDLLNKCEDTDNYVFPNPIFVFTPEQIYKLSGPGVLMLSGDTYISEGIAQEVYESEEIDEEKIQKMVDLFDGYSDGGLNVPVGRIIGTVGKTPIYINRKGEKTRLGKEWLSWR